MGGEEEGGTLAYEIESLGEIFRQLIGIGFVQESEMMYAPTEYDSGQRSRWKNITLQVTPTEQFSHTMSYLIQDLDPATQYEAKAIAKNRYGWSDPPREAFRFTTKGAGW